MGGLGECISLRDLDDDELREEEWDAWVIGILQE